MTNINSIKFHLGDAAANYTDEELSQAFEAATAEVESYCNRVSDAMMGACACKIAALMLLRRESLGLSSFGAAGVSESYVDGWPSDVVKVLNAKRRAKVV